MTAPSIPDASNIKRRRGRPKGSRNNAKHALSSPRRSARRHSTKAQMKPTCTNGDVSSHNRMRPADGVHVFQHLEHFKVTVAPYLHHWSHTERLRVALALRDFAHLCVRNDN
ncbi:hypothetical protein CF319_g8805 [Tilletia indica]|nr:hypothetical protein CF319_g8805 [Tilletia indica]KAE8233006.1 hypothetical protein CF326_g1957 [Tilletia indica]